MSTCKIKLDNNHLGFYYSGQVVKGIVEVTLKKALTCKALRLSISGKADFKWKDEKKEIHKQNETYLHNIINIFGDEESEPVEVEAGLHTFKFSTSLPLDIPSSFECKYGKIFYKIEAIFILPWKLNYLKTKTFFKVVSHVDLNADPSLKLPFYTEVTKKTRNFFFAHKTLHIKVCTPFSGFIAGHKVKLIFDVDNNTRKKVSKMVIHLVQVIKMSTGEITKIDRIIISEVFALGTGKKSINQFENDVMVPTNLVPVKHSNIINISYEFEITAKFLSSKTKNPKIIIPIEIGTVPIKFERSSRYSGNLNLTPQHSYIRSLSNSSAISPSSIAPMTPLFFEQLTFVFEDQEEPFSSY